MCRLIWPVTFANAKNSFSQTMAHVILKVRKMAKIRKNTIKHHTWPRISYFCPAEQDTVKSHKFEVIELWLSGRVLDSRPKGHRFEPHRRHCVVSLSKNTNPSLVLVQPRKTRPYITERLLMGRKESNQTNHRPFISKYWKVRAHPCIWGKDLSPIFTTYTYQIYTESIRCHVYFVWAISWQNPWFNPL